MIPTRYVNGVSSWAALVTRPFVTVHSEAARAVTVTWFDCAGAALVAFIVAWLVTVVPGAVPAGKCTVIDSWAVVPAGSGVNSVKSAVPVAGL